jgi:hypothetical protein
MPTGIDLVMVEVATVEGEPRNALEYVQDVYKGRRPADPWRMRAAIAALQFETPKLTATAMTNLNGQDFSSMLERAIARSEGKLIEHREVEEDGR